MKNWGLSLILSLVLLLTPALSGTVNAQSEAVLDTALESGTTTGDNATDNVTDNFTDNVTLTKSQILRLRGVPGKGILTAPGLQKPFNLRWKWGKSVDKNLELQQVAVTEQTQNSGEEQKLRVRNRIRQENKAEQQVGATEQVTVPDAGKGLNKGKDKGKP